MRPAARLLPLLLFTLLSGPAPAGDAPPAPVPAPAPPAPPAQEGEAYPLKLDRPSKPGQRASFSATGVQKFRTESIYPDRPTEVTSARLEVNYSAIHEVKAVDAAGRPTEVLLRIDRLITDDGSGPQEQFAAGTLVKALADGHLTRWEHNGEELEGTLTEALDIAGARVPAVNEPSEDEVFRNRSPRRTGESWDADPPSLARAIALTGPLRVAKDSSRAVMRLEEVLTSQQPPVLSVSCDYDLVPVAVISDGIRHKLSGSSVKARIVRHFPLDHALPILRETITSDARLRRPDGPGPEFQGTVTTMHREITRHILPLSGHPEPDKK